jgi:hypothetical protein
MQAHMQANVEVLHMSRNNRVITTRVNSLHSGTKRNPALLTFPKNLNSLGKNTTELYNPTSFLSEPEPGGVGSSPKAIGS